MEEKKEKTVVRVEIKDKLLLTVKEAAAYSGIGESRIQEMAREAKCPFVFHNGTKKLIKRRALEDFIENNIEI